MIAISDGRRTSADSVNWNDQKNYNGVEWNNPETYKNVDWAYVNYNGGAEATPASQKRQDWSDPETYKNVDWKTLESYKSFDCNNSKNYKSVEWANVNYAATTPTLEAPTLISTSTTAPPEGSPVPSKPVESLTTTTTGFSPSTAESAIENATPIPSQTAASDENAECKRLGPILNATLGLHKSCTSHCTQYDDRVNSLVGKMKPLDCDIDLYAGNGKNPLPRQESEIGQTKTIGKRGTVNVTQPKHVSCSILGPRLQSLKSGRDQCNSNCDAIEKALLVTAHRMAELDCKTDEESAKPIQRRRFN